MNNNKASSPLRAILSIGLNVGASEPIGQLQKTLNALAIFADYDFYKLGLSTWTDAAGNTVSERSIHVALMDGERQLDASQLTDLAIVLKQDAIGLTLADPIATDAVAWALFDGSTGKIVGALANAYSAPVHAGEELFDAAIKQATLFIRALEANPDYEPTAA